MFEHLNWLIFYIVAALSVLLGFFAVVGIWITGQPQQVTDDAEWGALHGLYALTAAVAVEACSIASALWLPASVRMGYVSGISVMNMLTLVDYGIAIAILALALVAVRRVRTLLARDVRIWAGTLLGINLIGGALFLISEMKN
ncbi:MAG TPA: hypothetical protein VJU82_14350 [Acidobacteriaceae bacterium]|nr:hypothetical protein [Acidobacteriaceae bacterium]